MPVGPLAAACHVDAGRMPSGVLCARSHDFKLIISLDADKYGAWEGAGHAPEEAFLAAAKAIPGVETVETQTFTIMPL